MGIELVSLGPLADNSGTYGPAFGQPTTAGNLLICWCSVNGADPSTPDSDTWVLAGNTGGIAIFYLEDCGADEDPPAFSDSYSDHWYQLAEFSGAATSSSLDGTVSSPAYGLSWIVPFATPDSGGGELIVVASYGNGSNAAGTMSLNEFTDSDGSTVSGTFTQGANIYGQAAGNVFGIAGIPGSLPHLLNMSIETTTYTGGFGATFKPAVPPESPALTVTTSSLPGRYTGVPYTAGAISLGGIVQYVTVAATGGTPQYTWSVTSGSLPDGLELDSSTGAITGTPSVAGTYDFTIEVTDSSSDTATADLSIVITGSPGVVYTDNYPPTQTWYWYPSPQDDQFTGLGPTDEVNLNPNVWGPIADCTQVTSIQSLRQWSIAANYDDPSAAVHTFPNTGMSLGAGLEWQNFSYLISGWDVYMDSSTDIVASGCYDNWFDQPFIGSDPNGPGAEVMLHFAIVNRGGGPYVSTGVTFGGYEVAGYDIPPIQVSCSWEPGYGTFYFNASPAANAFNFIPAGAADWKAMFQYIVDLGILPASARLTGFSVGFEVCTTTGNTNTFLYNNCWWRSSSNLVNIGHVGGRYRR